MECFKLICNSFIWLIHKMELRKDVTYEPHLKR
jgi:hypothetical protein